MLKAQCPATHIRCLTLSPPFGHGSAKGVVNDLSDNAYEFIGLLNHWIKLRGQEACALADSETESSLLRFFQGDAVLCDEIVVA